MRNTATRPFRLAPDTTHGDSSQRRGSIFSAGMQATTECVRPRFTIGQAHSPVDPRPLPALATSTPTFVPGDARQAGAVSSVAVANADQRAKSDNLLDGA